MCHNFIIFSSYLCPSVTKFLTAILSYLVLDCIIIIQSFIIVIYITKLQIIKCGQYVGQKDYQNYVNYSMYATAQF